MGKRRVKFRGTFKGTAEINLGKVRSGGRKMPARRSTKKSAQRKSQPKPEIPAMKRVHISGMEPHYTFPRVPVKTGVILDVQRGQNVAVRGPGVRGPTAEEMYLLFGKPRKNKKR